jgi:hypothetical protein
MSFPPPPYDMQDPAAPPYNSQQNPNYATFAQRYPVFPLDSSSNQSQVASLLASNTLFNSINAINSTIKSSGSTTMPYVLFKTERERIQYLQGQATSQRKALAMSTGTPAFSTPTASSFTTTVFGIINGN